ncbi:general substrate transporter [Zychaea mexicana]|uniref:general substrate transporter n=1 Tax=Zychaea mexicana TaxID=64656 RepID=UPI0022FF1E54|nr:general substrate transporter [Zychaea mexicana]KAI9488205.1 general substrate transporter [Zychaea mexicana]
MPTFPSYFGFAEGGADHIAQVKGDVVALLQAGCCAGALLINFFADPYGRKLAIIVSSVIFIVGGILQAVAQNLATMMAGRFVAGFGVGACSMLVPMYIAEISPRKLRGRLGTLWQFLIVLGIMMSYWVDYGCVRHIPEGDKQWRTALGIQIVPGGILLIGMFFLPESLRWLALKNRYEKVLKELCFLRDGKEDDPEIQEELQEIRQAVELELEGRKSRWSELLVPNNLRRLFIGVWLQIFQQWTGTNAVNYYAPDIFRTVGLSENNTDILATGVYGIVKAVFVIVAFFMIDARFGRRQTLMIGSVFMMVAFFILAGMVLGIQRDNGGVSGDISYVDAKGYVAIVMIYIFAVGYEFSWGPVVWVVCSEIFPTRIRAMCLSITTAFNWAMNATIAKVTPIMMQNITYGTYFFFGVCAIVMGTFTYVLVPETRGRSLEEMEEVFSGSVFAFKDTYVWRPEKKNDKVANAEEGIDNSNDNKP